MQPNLVVGNKVDADAAVIAEVTVAAFRTPAIGNHTEQQFIVEALRAAKALAVSRVAERDGKIVGHVAFSPVTISDNAPNWYGLGPVSVLPEYRRQGIGTALIHEDLSRLNTPNAAGCRLVGHPAYYRRFGFANIAGLVLEGVQPEVFFALPFIAPRSSGCVHCHEAFLADGSQRA